MKTFSVKDSRENGEKNVTIQVRGDIAGRDSERFCSKLDEFASSKLSKLVVDLRNVSFIDSAGLGTLVYKHIWMKERKKKMVILIEPGSNLDDLFIKTKLKTELNFG